jgi:hypothetical protein
MELASDVPTKTDAVDLPPPPVPAPIAEALAGDDPERLLSTELHGPTEGVEETLALAEQTVGRIRDYIVAHAEYDRDDCLWPSHFQVFSTNPMNVRYGATGTALFLNDTPGGVPPDAVAWMLDQPLDPVQHPPGLFTGLAGIAVALDAMGLTEKAEGAMESTFGSPMIQESEGLGYGAAGWGYALLRLHSSTGNDAYLDKAADVGDWLLKRADTDGNGGLYWESHDDIWTAGDSVVHLGYGHGASGVGLFLTHLYEASREAAYLLGAARAVNHDLAHGILGENRVAWGRRVSDNMTVPYWEYGSSGIGRVLVRLARHAEDPTYADVARLIARSAANVKFTVLPSMFMGLSGLGDYLLDVADDAEDPVEEAAYYRKALDIAESVLWFRLEADEGVAYPCRWHRRIDLSYGSGSAGVGLFLNRLLHRRRGRLLVDVHADA